jgi:hypothetical protein
LCDAKILMQTDEFSKIHNVVALLVEYTISRR